MKNINILPADTYLVVNKTIINASDSKIITMLYQPIIGYSAVSLYFTLIDDLDKLELMSEELTHHHLMSTMQLKLEDIIMALDKLEAVGLVKTYYKKDNINNFVYLLYSPLSSNEFFNHPILNIVLYNNLGKKEYEKVLNYYKVPRLNLKDYIDVTSSFDEVFTPISTNNFNIVDKVIRKEEGHILLNKSIDFNMLISSIPKSMLNEKCFTTDTKNLINSLSYTYNIDNLSMVSLVRDNINEKGLIDKINLRKSCRNYYQFENGGKLPTLIYAKQPEYLKKPTGDNSKWAKMVYTFENITPYDYLKSKYKDSEPTQRDLKIIEYLLIDQKLNPGVVNVLISYVLKVNNQKLNKNYIDTIVGQWKRLKIETVEEAMKTTEKEHKRIKKMVNKTNSKPVTYKNKKEDIVPDWFNKNLDSNTTTTKEEQEMTDILSSLE